MRCGALRYRPELRTYIVQGLPSVNVADQDMDFNSTPPYVVFGQQHLQVCIAPQLFMELHGFKINLRKPLPSEQ